MFSTIQEWAKFNMGREWGCQRFASIEERKQIQTEYPSGWSVAVEAGEYWVWAGPSHEYIYELAIYDGGLKNWRVLNLNSGSFYCMKYDSQEEAEASIKVGEERGGKYVKKVSRLQAIFALAHHDSNLL